MITVILSDTAKKNLSKLDKKTQKIIRTTLKKFRDNPGSVDFGKISSRKNEWKIKVGVWRIFMELDKTTKIYIVNEIKRRREDTYD